MLLHLVKITLWLLRSLTIGRKKKKKRAAYVIPYGLEGNTDCPKCGKRLTVTTSGFDKKQNLLMYGCRDYVHWSPSRCITDRQTGCGFDFWMRPRDFADATNYQVK